MSVDFTEAQPPATTKAIARLEQSLGVRLPDDYKRFLSAQNGGYLEPNFFPGDLGASARYLYSAGPNDDEYIDDVEHALHYLYLQDVELEYRLPTGFLPIGEDEGGNLICLRVVSRDYGAVYFWDHEDGTDPLSRIAESFSDFFEGLRPGPELDLA